MRPKTGKRVPQFRKWKRFIRATLFLPDTTAYQWDYENDWDGVVIDTKELSSVDISQIQMSEIKGEISTFRLLRCFELILKIEDE